MTIKEEWSILTDQERNEIINEFIDKVFRNFDYTEIKDKYDEAKELGLPTLATNNPCLILELIDPVLTYALVSWMYRESNHSKWKEKVPLFGYRINSFVYNKSSLIGYSEQERDILQQATEIINNKL